MTVENLKRCNNAFVFEYERQDLKINEEVILKVPQPVPNARSVNDICYIKSSNVELYGTISRDVKNAIWIRVDDGHDINLCVKYIKVISLSDGQYVSLRVAMN